MKKLTSYLKVQQTEALSAVCGKVQSADVSAELRRLDETTLSQLPLDRHAIDADLDCGGQSPDDNYCCWANPCQHFQEFDEKKETDSQLMTKDGVDAMKDSKINASTNVKTLAESEQAFTVRGYKSQLMTDYKVEALGQLENIEKTVLP